VSTPKKVHHINLLLVQNYYIDEDDETERNNRDPHQGPIKYHYVRIKDLSRLLNSQVSKKKRRIHLCDRCLQFFYSPEKLAAHEIDCREVNTCKPKMPPFWDRYMEFKNHKFKLRVPFVIYADLECIVKKVDENGQRGNSNIVQEHEPFSLAYYLHCSYDDSLSGFHSYRGPDLAGWFAQHLTVIAAWVAETYSNPVDMRPLTVEEERHFNNPTAKCHICNKVISPDLSRRARDYCHLTGEYRGPAHSKCNLEYQNSRAIPVVFHNMSNYDMHFLIRDLATKIPGRTTVIPQTKDKYISVTKFNDGMDVHFRFIDSFRFMASFLEKLASYLPATPITRHQFSALNDDEFRLLTRKGVFPYE